MKTIREVENELLAKERRIAYWERHHELPIDGQLNKMYIKIRR